MIKKKYQIKLLLKKRKKIMKKVIKRYVQFVVLFSLVSPIMMLAYMNSYKLINKIDNRIYDMYATSGKYTQNMFFSKDIEEKTNIYSELNNLVIKDEIEINRMQDFCNELLNNKSGVNELLENNVNYIKYLENENLTIDEFWFFVSKMSSLDINILKDILYIIMLILVLILYFVFNWRKGIYIVIFILYFIFILNDFSGGLFSYIIYEPLQNLNQFIKLDRMSIETYSTIFDLLLPITKESILTFILLDTVCQTIKDQKQKKKENLINETLSSLKLIRVALMSYKLQDYIYITGLRINFLPLIKIFSEKKYKQDKNATELLKLMKLFDENNQYALSQKELEEKIVITIKLIENTNIL